jgi:hypothetical protein
MNCGNKEGMKGSIVIGNPPMNEATQKTCNNQALLFQLAV